MLGGSAILLAAIMGGGVCAAPNTRAGSPHPLKASVTDILTIGKDEVCLTYSLVWVDDKPFLFPKAFVKLNIVFWDGRGNQIDQEIEDVLVLPKGFAAREVKCLTARLRVRQPKGATAVAIELGSSGISTERVVIPKGRAAQKGSGGR
jgi:hypothetical protein